MKILRCEDFLSMLQKSDCAFSAMAAIEHFTTLPQAVRLSLLPVASSHY